jgi:Flp pilus assembly protein TadG
VLGFNRKRLWRKVLAMLWSSRASQMVEFAVSLPLLVVFVVGIFDFGEAFNLKQKLNNVARESARFASSLPTNDLSDSGDPASIIAIRNLVSSSLRASRVNDCGLGSQTGTNAAPTWTYTASGNGCAGTLTLKIDVSLSYPYKWRFNRVITLVAPGAAYAGVTQIVTDAVVPNTY